MGMGGAPRQDRRSVDFFVFVLFDIDDDEGICGRFGRIGAGSQHIGSLALAMMRVSASLLVGHVTSVTWHMVEKDLDLCSGRCAKVRRQG